MVMESKPDSRRLVDVAWLNEQIKGTLFEGRLTAFNTVGSTNDVARRLARQGAPEGTLILAEHQTQGRGRFRRAWASPPFSGLWFSLLLRPHLQGDRLGLVSQTVAVAVADVLNVKVGVAARLKWPNDILVEGKKICGILCETAFSAETGEYLIAGIGLNINQTPGMFPDDLKQKSTSLRILKGAVISREQLLVNILQAVERYYRIFLQQRYGTISAKWESYAQHLGQHFRVHEADSVFDGAISSVDDFGRLLLRLPGGQLRATQSTNLEAVK